MVDEETYRRDLDREAVAHARKRFPDLTRVRRVRVDDEGPTPHQARVDREHREMAQAVHADHERERDHEGADDGTDR
jgi:hypothetical protein